MFNQILTDFSGRISIQNGYIVFWNGFRLICHECIFKRMIARSLTLLQQNADVSLMKG